MMPRVANNLPDNFRFYRLAFANQLPISATGDVLIGGVQPLSINGLLFTIERIHVFNPAINGVSGDVSAGALGVFTGAGATGTTIAANQSLTTTQITGTTALQSLTMTLAATTTVAGPVGLYVNVGTAVAGGTISISVFGSILQP